ncbi:protease SohB [Pseudoalteromonas ardens]|uniref:Peptidase S49 n=1 Tax=Pseudoalteromonas rubra TaxID=43658 RepID=A0A0L0EXC2_9GAMM|nr:protease SohB [Pseudoalteromonas sp. R96]KNC69065.1 peptidase S49 [Pseudoalteromonas rubra]MDK1313671.1 protease SohB [Pseudoalteromonas sp. R96]
MVFLYEYGLFLAKAVTLVAALGAIIAMIVAASHKPSSQSGEIELTNLSKRLDEAKEQFLAQTLDKKALKSHLKQQKKTQSEHATETKKRVFVVEFCGSMDAHEVENLREEVTAILTIADAKQDQVVVNLESGGGVVHGYGLAASQLQRFKDAGLPLTVCVDKIAASGGYMMACVADKIIAAPFAIVGSIGVIAQMPNFNKLLKKNDIDYEQITAGEFKRTLTLFGENTDKGREKFREEVEHTHGLFKRFVSDNRPNMDIDKVATGEHWLATHAHEFALVDEIRTSDDLLLDLNQAHQLYQVRFKLKKSLAEKLGVGVSLSLEKGAMRLFSKWQKSSY